MLEKKCAEGELHIYESDDETFNLKDVIALIAKNVYPIESTDEQIINLPEVSVILTK